MFVSGSARSLAKLWRHNNFTVDTAQFQEVSLKMYIHIYISISFSLFVFRIKLYMYSVRDVL